MATHSSIPAWRIPWTEEPGGLQSMGSQRVRHDWATNTFTFPTEDSDLKDCALKSSYPLRHFKVSLQVQSPLNFPDPLSCQALSCYPIPYTQFFPSSHGSLNFALSLPAELRRKASESRGVLQL